VTFKVILLFHVKDISINSTFVKVVNLKITLDATEDNAFESTAVPSET